MDCSKPCQSCGKRSLITDDVTGKFICALCSIVQDFDNYETHFGGVTGPTGTYVRTGTAGSGSAYSYKDTKIYNAQKSIDEITLRLGLPVSKFEEVKNMVTTITEGEYGTGDWFPVFVGACSYVVMRKDNKFISVVKVASTVGCDVSKLGHMITRVVNFLELKLPNFNIVISFEQVIKSSPWFGELFSGDLLGKIMEQGVFLLQCSVKWYLTTGRRPMPLVVAVLVFVAELNEVNLQIEDLATELHVPVVTCRKRYKELLERLVMVAQALPWGKDVTVKNIMKNATFVMQYMELKSLSKPCDNGARNEEGDLGFHLDDVIDDCLNRESKFELYSYDNTNENERPYFQKEHSRELISENLESLELSYECLSMMYSKFVDEVSDIKSTIESGEPNRRKRKRSCDIQTCIDWWRGNSELCKRLLIKGILEKDVGLDSEPPAYVKGCLRYKKRGEKIKAAKLRIEKIMHPEKDVSGEKEDGLLSEKTSAAAKKRRKRKFEIDWEDLIIETLLLHKVDEKEILKGYYNALLGLHVFNS